jgi:hypothetical protein
MYDDVTLCFIMHHAAIKQRVDLRRETPATPLICAWSLKP